MENIAILNGLWPLLGALCFLLMGWGMWHLSKRFPSRQAHEALKGEVKALQSALEGVNNDLARVSGKLESLPAAAEFQKILLGLAEVQGAQNTLLAKFEGQQEVLKRIEHPVQLLMGEAIKGGRQHHAG